MPKNVFYFNFLLILFISCCFSASAQEALPTRESPLAIVTMKYEDTYVKVTYGRPHKRGREIFGGLVAYDSVWRTGANEATEITVTDKIKINGKKLKAGTYSLFTIPRENEWTIILNSELGQWGDYTYDPAYDVIRFTVPVQQTDVMYEPFTMEFEQEENVANLLMKWDRTKVSIPIEFR